jgi:hypothetical protein
MLKIYVQLEDYLLLLGWGYLEDKLNCIKDIKVCSGGGLVYSTTLLGFITVLWIRGIVD